MRFLGKIILSVSIGVAVEIGCKIGRSLIEAYEADEWTIPDEIMDLYEKYKPANDEHKGSVRTMTKEETAAADNELRLKRIDRQEVQVAYAEQAGTRTFDEAIAWGAENDFVQDNGLVYVVADPIYISRHPKNVRNISGVIVRLAQQADFNRMYGVSDPLTSGPDA